MEFAGNNVKVLVDAFGRMMVMNDGGNISGVAWNDEGITDDFDNMGSMSTQFNAIRNEWGEHDCITEDTGTTVTFTTDDEPVLLTFDTQTNNFVPVVGELTDGTPNMFTRTLNDGTSDVTIVCDADGKLCVIDGTHYIQKSAQDEFSLVNDDTKLLALTTAAGGTVAVTATESSDTDMTKITNGNYFFVFNQDGYVTFGIVSAWPIPIHYRLYHHNEVSMYYLVDDDGHFISIATEGSQHERGYYASEENFDPIDSWDEGSVDDDVIENWGLTRVELSDSLNFNLDGVFVQYNGMGGFNMTPTEYQ